MKSMRTSQFNHNHMLWDWQLKPNQLHVLQLVFTTHQGSLLGLEKIQLQNTRADFFRISILQS